MELINNVYSHHQFTHYCIDMYGEVTTPSEIKCMIEKFHEHTMDPNICGKIQVCLNFPLYIIGKHQYLFDPTVIIIN